MSLNKNIPAIGQMVIVRGRPAIVRDIIKSKNGTNIESYNAVEIQYIDGWSHPERDVIIWERECLTEIIKGNMLPKIDSDDNMPDEPDKLNAFINSYRWSAVTRFDNSVDNINLIAPWQSAVQIEDYQLYPVLKSLAMPRVSLLLADDVGLGKTIEAGLIVSELIARNRVKRAMVICPASLQIQWKEELKEKFHLDFEIIDRKKTFDVQRTMGVNSNPWAIYPRVITSMDYLRQVNVQQLFKSATSSINKNLEGKLPWQMLIVDEAHNFAPSGIGTNTQRYEMLREISLNFEHKLFLTATPHNGYTHSFSGLLELLDPVRFEQKTELEERDHRHLETVMVRRLKRELNTSKHKRFSKRYVEAVDIKLYDDEIILFESLRKYRKSGQKLLSGKSKTEKQIGDFLFKLLTKRLLSSTYAFAMTWWKHVEGMSDIILDDLKELEYAKNRLDTSVDDDIEKEQREEDVIRKSGGWLSNYSNDLRDEINSVNEILKKMGLGREVLTKEISSIGIVQNESKWDELYKWIKEKLIDGSTFNKNERVIIFTEYRQTLEYLMERFKLLGIKEPIVDMLYGGMSNEKRQDIKERFNNNSTPLRILLATDAASEGINLQSGCRYIFHYDIPWNPMRMEQRNGRVDRHGQYRDIYISHFTSKDDEDLSFLSRIAEKIDQVREDLGSVGQILDKVIETHFSNSENSKKYNSEEIIVGHSYQVDFKEKNNNIQKDSTKALQRLRATESLLELNPQNIANIVKFAMEEDNGELEEINSEGGKIYRIKTIPPSWSSLIDDTIRIKSGINKGALPRFVFDSDYFENEVDGYTVYSYKENVILLRLGHPLVQKAILNTKRALWGGSNLKRWTVQKAKLPNGIEEIVEIKLLLEVTNKLNEVIHEEVVTLCYQSDGEKLIKIEDSLLPIINSIKKKKLDGNVLFNVISELREEWDEIKSDVKNEIQKFKEEKKIYFSNLLDDTLEKDREIQKQVFENRMKELKQDKLEKKKNKMREDIKKQEIENKTVQMSLLEDTEALAKEKLKNIEIQLDLIISNTQIMRDILEREKDRVINKVLPQRYSLNTVEVHPLAIQYIVKDEEVK